MLLKSLWRLLVPTCCAALLLLEFAVPAEAAPTAERRRGAVDGIWYWQLPNAPSGTRPIQAWSGAGSAPDGTIYIAGMDHVQNSVLYRLTPDGVPEQRPGRFLSYVGDARAASRNFNRWRPGDVAEKFHTRPTWHRSQIWVATLNHSSLDDGYLQKNGFRWYQYNPVRERLADRGLGAGRGGLVAIGIDHVARKIYGAMLPTGDLYVHDIVGGLTSLLGRPDYQRPYVYAGRALWVDATGRVYFSAGHTSTSQGAPYDPAIFNHMHYWDPIEGFGQHADWQLFGRAIDMVQCFPAAATCYLGDDAGNLFRFTEPTSEAPATWTHLLQVETLRRIWVMQVSPEESHAYFVADRAELLEYDLGTLQLARSVSLRDVAPQLDVPNFYGHDAWDLNGRFYIAAFGRVDAGFNARLVAIDPARLFAAVGVRR